MSDREMKDFVAGMKTLQESHKSSPEKALAFLVKAGIATQDGKLAAQYKKSA